MNVRYKENALDCIRLAQISDDRTEKALLLGLAQAWLRLGEQGKAVGELNELAGRPVESFDRADVADGPTGYGRSKTTSHWRARQG
jgi:hypothetical protein